MKPKLCILITGILLVNTLVTSQVYTPKGSLVPDTEVIPEQLTSSDTAYIMQYMANSYSNAVIMGNPTTTYNCHAYAWHISEGGTPLVWMGLSTNPTPIYWNDGSYVETAERGNGLKVSYDNPPYNGSDKDNHSAVTTSEVGVFISKWGSYPLVKHAKDYSPYTYSSLHYYKKNTPPPTIDGPVILCPYTNRIYKVVGKTNTAPVTWTFGDDGLSLVNASGDSATIRATATVPTAGVITASFSGISVSMTVYTINYPAPLPFPSWVPALLNTQYTIQHLASIIFTGYLHPIMLSWAMPMVLQLQFS